MTASIPTTSQQHDTEAQSKLHRRRDKAQAAKAAADKARAGVTQLDDQLKANATQTQNVETALQRAQEEVARLKKALKASIKERAKLRSARKRAQDVAGRTQRRAETAEAKYDKIVLAELVRREKDKDRARSTSHDVAETPEPKAAEPATAGAPAPVTDAPERPGGGAMTAIQTAARKTAAVARGKQAPTRGTGERRPTTASSRESGKGDAASTPPGR